MSEPYDNESVIVLDDVERKSLLSFARTIDPEPYDLLLVGDGSGQDYRQIAAWSCIACDRIKKSAVIHVGMVTAGTNKFAEVFPYLHALWFFGQEHQGDKNRPYQVVVLSGSTVTVRCGKRRCERRANGCYWAGIDWFERNGYRFRWHHVSQDSNRWNECVEFIASHVRGDGGWANQVVVSDAKSILGVKNCQRAVKVEGFTPYEELLEEARMNECVTYRRNGQRKGPRYGELGDKP